jgi:glycine cleavage system aminomethyltransferase T
MSDPTIAAVPTSGSTGPPPLRSPLAGALESLGAITGVEGSAEVTRSFGDPDGEREAIASALGVADVTVRAKIDLRGHVDDAYAGLDGDVWARIADDWALVFAPPGPVDDRIDSMAERGGPTTMVTDATHLFAGLALAGPHVPEAVARLSSWDPATLAEGAATGAPIADIGSIVLRRDTSMPLLEIYVAMESARYLWRSVLEVASELGGCVVGWDALRAHGWR